MFHQLAFLACTFFVTGAICLGGALFQGYSSFQERLDWRDAQVDSYVVAQDDRLTKLVGEMGDGFDRMGRRVDGVHTQLLGLKADVGEGFAKRDHQLAVFDSKIQKVADDFYRHLSLNAKKKIRGHQ